MRIGLAIATMAALLSGPLGALNAAPHAGPPAPLCAGCQTCQTPPCGCAGHAPGCCCEGVCQQAPPNPLEPGRPSPPPCCADGICYPNYQTWGHYATRWRRWPIELATAQPTDVTTPLAPTPDLPGYQTPPPEEEDRRAPPPSAPRGEPVPIGPRAGQQEAAEEEAPTEGATPPATDQPPPSPESIFGFPTEEMPPTTEGVPPLGAPIEETPTTTPLVPPAEGGSSPATAPADDPFGDADPAPAPPFATRQLNRVPTAASGLQPVLPVPKPAIRQTAPQDDPAPAMPTLASATR
jgi:hypothetical protein